MQTFDAQIFPFWLEIPFVNDFFGSKFIFAKVWVLKNSCDAFWWFNYCVMNFGTSYLSVSILSNI